MGNLRMVLAYKSVLYITIAFNHALRHQLRRSDPWADIEKYLEADDIEKLRQSQNLPDAILRLMGRKLGSCRHKNLLSDFLIQSLDEHITSMAGVQAACERIQNTPVPFAYTLLVQRTAYLYCFILPFGIVASQGLLTPLFCAIIAYTFFGLDPTFRTLPIGQVEIRFVRNRSHDVSVNDHKTNRQSIKDNPLRPLHTVC